eukprot:393403_1
MKIFVSTMLMAILFTIATVKAGNATMNTTAANTDAETTAETITGGTNPYATPCKNYLFTSDLTIPFPVGSKSCYVSHKSVGYPYSFNYKCEEKSGVPYAVQYYYDASDCAGAGTKVDETKCSSVNDYCECTINGDLCDLFTYQFDDDESLKTCGEGDNVKYQFVTNVCLKWNSTHSVDFYCNGYNIDYAVFKGMNCPGATTTTSPATTTTTAPKPISISDISCDQYTCNNVVSPK